MHDLIPQTPLGATTPLQETVGDTDIHEVTDLALASVAARFGREHMCRTALAKHLGGDVPDVGKSLKTPPYSTFWTGPDQWMVQAPVGSHEMLAQNLTQALGSSASIAEQNDGWVMFNLSGPKVVDLLERLCPAPARRMAAGDAQRTPIHHLGCFVICIATAKSFRILGPRSSAGSLYHALHAAALAVA